MDQHRPPHPGRFIQRVYLQPLNLAHDNIAEKLQISSVDLDALINEKQDVTPAMAQKLSRTIGRSAESWMLMQKNFNYSLEKWNGRKT